MNTKVLLITGLVSLSLTACGSNTGTDEPLDTETADLKNNAVGAIGGSFDGSLNAVSRTVNQNSSVGSTINDVATGGSDQMVEDIPTDAGIHEGVEKWMSVSLATDENSDSTTTRNGNVITVDPDEEALCREEFVFDQSTAEEVASCTAFFKDVSVRLVATSEEAGVLTYLYQQQPIISLGYAPNSESIELDFGGLKAAVDGYSALDVVDLPITSLDEMTGSIKFTTTETTTTEGQQAGSISFEVAKPIQIASINELGEESSLSMQTGTLFSISADAATGQGSMSFDLAAISAAAPTDSGLGQMNLAGFTGQADVNPTDGVLVVRNFGLSKGPFNLSINNEEVISATLGAFGFHVTEGTDMEPGELIIDGNMDLSVMAKEFANGNVLGGPVSKMLDMMAPAGTSLSRAGNGATQVGGAGPFTISLGETSAQGDQTLETIVVNSGQCFPDLSDDSVPPSAEQCL